MAYLFMDGYEAHFSAEAAELASFYEASETQAATRVRAHVAARAAARAAERAEAEAA